MGYNLLSKTEPKARKDHRCIWCGQAIPKGTKYVSERSVYDGDMQNHHWHFECWSDAQHNNDEPEWEFTPYSYDRPKEGDYERTAGN